MSADLTQKSIDALTTTVPEGVATATTTDGSLQTGSNVVDQPVLNEVVFKTAGAEVGDPARVFSAFNDLKIKGGHLHVNTPEHVNMSSERQIVLTCDSEFENYRGPIILMKGGPESGRRFWGHSDYYPSFRRSEEVEDDGEEVEELVFPIASWKTAVGPNGKVVRTPTRRSAQEGTEPNDVVWWVGDDNRVFRGPYNSEVIQDVVSTPGVYEEGECLRADEMSDVD